MSHHGAARYSIAPNGCPSAEGRHHSPGRARADVEQADPELFHGLDLERVNSFASFLLVQIHVVWSDRRTLCGSPFALDLQTSPGEGTLCQVSLPYGRDTPHTMFPTLCGNLVSH